LHMKFKGFIIGFIAIALLITASFVCEKLGLYALARDADVQTIRTAFLGVTVLGFLFIVLLVGSIIYYVLFRFRSNKNA